MSSQESCIAKRICLNHAQIDKTSKKLSPIRLNLEQKLHRHDQKTDAKATHLSIQLPSYRSSLPIAQLVLDSANLESRQYGMNFDNAYQTLEGNSWDYFDKELICVDELVWYDRHDLDCILFAGRNVVLGLGSNFFEWDGTRMQFVLRAELSNASFASCLEQLSHCGSFIRRLLQATEDIRQATAGSNAQTILALSAQIEREVHNQLLAAVTLQDSRQLIHLVHSSQPLLNNITTLAELIGCHDLASGGRLKRVPSIAELLQRTYERAVLGNSPILWRLVGAALTPWIRQLNFATGLIEYRNVRSASFDLKLTKFPELFIDIDEDLGTIVLTEGLVPQFFPMVVAHAVLDCYKLLCYLGAWVPNGRPSICQTSIPPIELITPPAIDQTMKINLNLIKADRNLDPTVNSDLATPNPRDRNSGISINLLSGLSPILYRRAELDLDVKRVLLPDLRQFCKIATNAFMLNNGELWSRLTDLLPIKEQKQFLVIHDLFEKHGANVVMFEGRLLIKYVPKKVITTVFGANIIARLQAVFDKLLALYVGNRTSQLADLGLQIEAKAVEIDTSLHNENAGIFDLIKAFDSIM